MALLIKKIPLFLFLVFCFVQVFGQHQLTIDAQLDEENKTIAVQQEILYRNNSETGLTEIYLNDWANSFSSKTSPLAKRFSEDFVRRFHFSKEEERGFTQVNSISNENGVSITWERPEKHLDILHLNLNEVLYPGEELKLNLSYQIKIPDSKFTRYGYSKNGFKLRYWAITPSVFKNGEWQFYSNKNLNDQYNALANAKVNISLPKDYQVFSSLRKNDTLPTSTYKNVLLKGENITDLPLYAIKKSNFETIVTDKLEVVTNIEDDSNTKELKAFTIDRIVHYLYQRLGAYPHKKLMVTQEDYLANPVYGLNQLPSFIRPFPDGFQYDIKSLKTITEAYLDQTILVNPRTEAWIKDAIIYYLLMDYVDTYYPNTKLLGSFSEFIGIKWFHAADLNFNDRYPFFALNSTRLNLDQPLTMSQDSLVKYNKNISNPYKAGIGFNYLNDYLESKEPLHNSIKEYYQEYKLQQNSTPSDFESILKENAPKEVDWFFTDYVAKNTWIDFKIKKAVKKGDSLEVTLKNKHDINVPISIYGIKDKQIVSKFWVNNVDSIKTVTIPNQDLDRLSLNYEGVIPEFNRRNNYKKVSKFFNKPLQIRLLEDIEDPNYEQLFLIPEFDYNLYDGFIVGPKLYNTTILRRNFSFKVAPKIGFRSKALIGSAGFSNTHQFQNQELNAVTYGLSGSRYSYAFDLFYNKVTPFFSIQFRDDYLRNNEFQALSIRSVNVFRDRALANPVDEPDYSVVDIQYNYRDVNFRDYLTANVDYQVAKKFSKISFTAKWRELFLNNRQIELRAFTGFFLFNDSQSDYFSFALDRPTDYLFDYNYYGRSESSGLFSQQFIEAEGGFKSQLEPRFANQFISTLNGSFTIWNWIHAYGDAGVVKNRGENMSFLYDSGVRVNLVQDYFEIFFPMYSSKGWEPGQDNYDQKIRFIVSLDFNTLIKLFTRRWY